MKDNLKWFAMGAPYRNEVKAFNALMDRGIECFLPIGTTMVEKNGKKTRVTGPLVSNLLFVHTTEAVLKDVKPEIPRLQYKIVTECGQTHKVVVPDEQMANFIRFVKIQNEDAVFLSPHEVDLKAGTRLKIVGGHLDGIECTLVKVHGHRSKALSITLDGLVSAIVQVSPEYIQLLK